MTSTCRMPDVQMALLDAARFDDALDDDLSLHLAGCEDCHTAVERLRRMASTWTSDAAAAPENELRLQAATERFAALATLRRQERWRASLPFALAGAAAGLAVLVATHRIGGPSPQATEPTAQANAASLAAGRKELEPGAVTGPASADRDSARASLAVPHVEGPRGVTPLSDGLRIELKAGEAARVALANGQSSELRGPCAVEFWSSSTEVGGWRLAPVKIETADTVLPEPEVAARAAVDRARSVEELASAQRQVGARETAPSGAAVAEVPKASAHAQIAWERAAEAMRRDDFGGADAAFGELCRAPDAATRDKARLARAQLWIAHGRGAQVQAVLTDLAANGSTPLVRQRAAEFLSREP